MTPARMCLLIVTCASRAQGYTDSDPSRSETQRTRPQVRNDNVAYPLRSIQLALQDSTAPEE